MIAAFFKKLFGGHAPKKAEAKKAEVCRARIDGGDWVDIDPDGVECALMNGYEVQWDRWKK